MPTAVIHIGEVETESQEDGSWALVLDALPAADAVLVIERPHFATEFVVGERFHIVPAVPALVGAAGLLVWLKPNIQKMIKSVDWTTLVFFMALFMVVGAVQEVGLISVIAQAVSSVVGSSLPLAVIFIVFGVGTMSIAVANIPLTASMLPVVEFLSGTVPGANSKVLYYALSMGAAMGGNGFLISAEANLVTAGITAQADSPISFFDFSLCLQRAFFRQPGQPAAGGCGR